MRHATQLAILLTATGLASAQNQPQLTWQGEVAGGATLFIQGNRVDMEGRTTGAVDRPTYRFRDNLPAFEQTVTVGIRRGGGTVRVVEQPQASNQYSAVVDIRNDGRPQMYRLEFFWDSSAPLNSRTNRRGAADDYGYRGRANDRGNDRLGRANGRADGPGSVTWSGQVDNEAIIILSGRRAFTTSVRGRAVLGERADFTAPLPRQDTSVAIVDAQGRGRIELVEQPSSANNFAAKVRVLDPEAGADTYSFRLEWNGGGGAYNDQGYGGRTGGILSPTTDGPATQPGYSGGGGYAAGGDVARWSGRVDGTVRVHMQGNRIWSQTVSGRPAYDERISAGSALPRRNIEDVDLRKVSGRDDVRVLQRPSANNNYTLIFEIEDEDAGADFYEVEIGWR